MLEVFLPQRDYYRIVVNDKPITVNLWLTASIL